MGHRRGFPSLGGTGFFPFGGGFRFFQADGVPVSPGAVSVVSQLDGANRAVPIAGLSPGAAMAFHSLDDGTAPSLFLSMTHPASVSIQRTLALYAITTALCLCLSLCLSSVACDCYIGHNLMIDARGTGVTNSKYPAPHPAFGHPLPRGEGNSEVVRLICPMNWATTLLGGSPAQPDGRRTPASGGSCPNSYGRC